jgi:enoyl-[acyl-carrier protein] reductase I
VVDPGDSAPAPPIGIDRPDRAHIPVTARGTPVGPACRGAVAVIDLRHSLIDLLITLTARVRPGPAKSAPDSPGFGSTNMSDLSGKHGLVVGVANKRSIVWAIAEAAARAGARLAVTYQDRFEDRVRALATELVEPLIVPCDVTNDSQIAGAFAEIDRAFGGLDFLVHGAAFAPTAELAAPFVQTSREGFRTTLDVSAYSLIALARGAAPLMIKHGGGSILTLTYLGSNRVVKNYNVMGVAKAALEASVRYLAADLGPHNIRVNAISAGPIKTLAAMGISGFSNILGVYRERAPLARNIDAAEVADAAMFLIGPSGRAVTAETLFVDAGFHAMGF